MNVKQALKIFFHNGLVKGVYLLYLNTKFKGAIIESVRVHPGAQLNGRARVSHDVRVGSDVEIGDYSYVMPYSTVLNASIGRYCSVGSYVSIGGWQHPYSYITTSPRVYREILGVEYNDTGRPVQIDDDVWIGDGAIILSGHICKGAIVAAGAVVTSDVPEYEIWAGVPAKKIGCRFGESFNHSVIPDWTKWSAEQIRMHGGLFLSKSEWALPLKRPL